MFKKKNCGRCGNRINEKHEFCPNCGNKINEKQENLGILGKNDFISMNNEIKLPRGLNMLFNSLMKNLGKELNKEFSEANKKAPIGKIRKSGISINISTSGNKPPEIRINSFGDNKNLKPRKREQIKEAPLTTISQNNLRKMIGLPKEEPATNIRRFSDKVVYEIEIPEVKSLDDISIIKLENSIEIKAFAGDKVYFKLIPINFPITHYNLSKGKLVLELAAKD